MEGGWFLLRLRIGVSKSITGKLSQFQSTIMIVSTKYELIAPLVYPVPSKMYFNQPFVYPPPP